MNIFMLYPCQGNMMSFNYGLASVVAVLKKAGHQIRLCLVSDYTRPGEILRSISDFGTQAIGFSCTSNYWEYVKNLSSRIKSTPIFKNIPIFVGGPHAISCPSALAESENINGFCVSEGERAFPEVIDKISRGRDFKDTMSFHFKNNSGGLIRNDIGMLIEDLDELPFPDRDSYPQKVFLNYANFMFSRGCPYSCSYCCNSVYHKIFNGKGRMIRHRSVPKAIEEIRIFLEKYRPAMLSFDDDCFNKNPKWFKEFCSEYKAKIGLPYTCNTRPELLDEESARLLKESGCRKINIGVESGDERLRKEVLNRNIKDEQIISAFEYARKYGMETMSFNMVGIPGETEESVCRTIELNRRIKPTYAQVSIFYPYAGTPLGELCREKGYIDSTSNLFSYFSQGSSVLTLPGLSKREIKDMFFKFQREISGNGRWKKFFEVCRNASRRVIWFAKKGETL